ncbi:hypothetical protein NOZ09_001561 [Klebsiella pneumoniae]|nr:hypothetical protein NOZ09_001561 [Klebsiella pneumoniae]SYP13706.1 Uncharacterised protein [Klebsiella pneumoniae]HBZ7685205.1 hypothetical protein [Klebsiella pneumoniae]
MSTTMTISEVYEVGSEFFKGGNFFVEIHRHGIRFVHEEIIDGKDVVESYVLQRGLNSITAPEVRGFLEASKEEPNHMEI